MSEFTDITEDAIDESQLMTLKWVVKMLKKYDHNLVIRELESMIKDRELIKQARKEVLNFDDDGFELPHLDPEDDPDTRSRMEKEIDQGKIDPRENEVPF